MNQQFLIFEVKTTIKITFKKSANLDIFVVTYFQQKISLKMVKM